VQFSGAKTFYLYESNIFTGDFTVSQLNFFCANGRETLLWGIGPDFPLAQDLHPAEVAAEIATIPIVLQSSIIMCKFHQKGEPKIGETQDD